MHELVARCVAVVEECGLPYRVGAMGTVVQGTVDELFDLAAKMHAAARGDRDGAPRVLTTLRIDDQGSVEHNLDDRVRIIEKSLTTTAP